MRVRVCQLFEVCQHEFANFSLPCEGRVAFRLHIERNSLDRWRTKLCHFIAVALSLFLESFTLI